MEERIPGFLAARLEKAFPPETLERILEGYGSKRKTAFRVNPLKGEREDVRKELAAAGICAEPLDWYEDGFTCPPGSEPVLRRTDAYAEGKIYLQNPSSMIPPVLLGNCEGSDVLDMCAAPGGKTTQIYALSGGKCGLMACEQDRVRAEKLRHNLDVQGVRANVAVADARKLDSFFRFDRILLDAPCSGSGTVLLDRENTYRSMSDLLVKNCARLQLQLLKKAASLLKKGGEMVYSTCSILPEEDEGNVKALLAGGRMRTLPLPERLDGIPRAECGLEDGLLVLPTETYEGFFAVRLQKTCE